MKVKFWGVRGSVPTPGPETAYYGGNTTCIQVILEKGPIIIFDSGTGIRGLGQALMRNPGPPFNIKVLVTHTHWDHIHGFPFFVPIFIPGGHIDVYGVGPIHQGVSFEKVMRDQMTYSYFPVENTMVDGVVHYHDFHEIFANRPSGVEGEYDLCEGVKLKLKLMNHPVYALGYRVEAEGHAVVFTGDHEPYIDVFADAQKGQKSDDDFDPFSEDEEESTSDFVDMMNERFVQFIKGADLLVIDSQYTKDEYFSPNNPAMSKKNWGHGYFDSSLDFAKRGEVKRVAFTHHEPTRVDKNLRKLELEWIEKAKTMAPGIEAYCTREGWEIDLSKPAVIPEWKEESAAT